MTTRRDFIAGAGAVAIVLGFDPRSRSWVTEAAAGPLDHFPDIEGVLTTDPALLALYATDAGNQIHHTPVAVLYPVSVRDIQKAVRFCKKHRISVAARGQGHTTFGQSQTTGLVIDMGSISDIHSIGAEQAIVGGGTRWRELLEATVPLGLTPPVLTGYISLSVGGTLSVGGVSPGYNRGAQVDHTRELEVVTGEGQRKVCSAKKHSDLFYACLAGLGQCGIITRAVVDLVPAPESARTFVLNHSDNAAFFGDLRKLLARGELDDVYNFGVPDGSGGWVYQLTCVKFFSGSEAPDGNHLLRDLSLPPSAAVITDRPYLEHELQVDVVIDFFRAIGLWDGVLHPWFDVFLPDSAVEGYVGNVMSELQPEDVGPTGFLLLFPQRRAKLTRPFFRVPGETEWVYLFDILTAASAPGPNPPFEAQIMARNRRLFEDARALGGTRYPIGSVAFSHSDWVTQYGESWPEFERAKRRYDPRRILSPGSGIF